MIDVFGVLSRAIEKEPGFIVGPIATFFGYIINVIYDVIAFFGIPNTFGISIIILTIIFKSLMIPFTYKTYKSMAKVKRLAPEVEKIKAKYGGTKDPELTKKMNIETQALYSKNKANPFGGCLPMLITLPFFYGLNYIARNAYIFIGAIKDVYMQISDLMISAGSRMGGSALKELMEREILGPMLEGSIKNGSLADPNFMMSIVHKMNLEDWSKVYAAIPSDIAENIQTTIQYKNEIETFLDVNMINVTGYAWPGIAIVILTVVTTFLSQYLMNKSTVVSEPSQKTQQKIMLFAMPFFMGWITAGFSGAVGVYWIVNSIYTTLNQMWLNKYYKDKSPIIGTNGKPIIEGETLPEEKKSLLDLFKKKKD